jgi:hypothetical protein
MTLVNSGSGVTANCLYANLGGLITFSTVVFGACGNFQVFANGAGKITATGPYTISGSAAGHVQSNFNSVVSIVGLTITLVGTPAFSSSFATAALDGAISIYGCTFSGSATGVRYNISSNGVVTTNGAGASYLPGSASGAFSSGGEYV